MANVWKGADLQAYVQKVVRCVGFIAGRMAVTVDRWIISSRSDYAEIPYGSSIFP